MTAVLMEDLKRTEPYARLARSMGAEASTSILKVPGAWWSTLYDGFAKKKNGSRSWTLICAVLVNIIGFLVISPLSSAFLFSEEVVVPQSTHFTNLIPVSGSGSGLPINADRSTNFRTIAHLLQNVSTSPWITDDYTILPFWPADLHPSPITSLPTISTQKWKSETTMFKSELSCTEMKLEQKTSGIVEYDQGGTAAASNSTVWSSPDGCRYGISVPTSFWNTGGGSWSDASTFYWAESALDSTDALELTSNHTAECNGRDIILVTESWESENAIFSAHVCETQYLMANITATISLTGNDPDIEFDETEFEENKISIPDTLFNTTQFRARMLDSSWPTYMISILWSNTAVLGGPSVLLGALYDYNMTALVNSPDWVSSAAKAQQRYFGEVLQTALLHEGASQTTALQGVIHDIESRVVVQAGPAIALGVLFGASFVLLLVVWWGAQLRRRPLNLKDDPASTLGVACLMAQNDRVRSGFQVFRQPSGKHLREMLHGQWFYTDPHGLTRYNPGEAARRGGTQSENGTPRLLRLPALLALITVLLVVGAGIAVLWHFAESVGLYEKAFVYQVDISFLSNSMSSVVPISIVPTLIAAIIGLWWNAIDEKFRHLQPYLAMLENNPPLARGAGLSYQSSFWMWACVKAALNQHWLLSLLTLGSTLSPVYTTAMSALFDRGPGVVTQPLSLNNSLEIRNIPFVFPTEQSYYPDASNDYAGVILADLYKNLSTHWMYTATIQLTLNGSEPAWSKDGWNFVPVKLNPASRVALPNDLDESDEAAAGAPSNISFSTPALRGRIECSPHPSEAFQNTSHWLTPRDLSNSTKWNTSTIPHGLTSGYQLGTSWIYKKNNPSVILPPHSVREHNHLSRLSGVWDPSVAVGYWSPNTNLSTWTTREWHRNFTAKWFYGNAVTGIKSNQFSALDPITDIDLLFPSPPSLTMLNCRPVIESASATVTVNPANGQIQSYAITKNPQERVDAFADNFLPHNGTHFNRTTGMISYNVTVSYGRLFMASMLTAADTLHIGGAAHIGGYTTEDLDDNTYNIRDKAAGLNLDFMSYAMYSMAGKDASALADPVIYATLAQRAFTTFFQHFVSSSATATAGGWGYQEINASLPNELGPVVELVNDYLPGTVAAAYQDTTNPISRTNRTAAATVSQRVELLRMNAVAVWLSIGIMGWLVVSTVVVAVLQRRYFGSLVRNVESLGDVLVLVAGSANLLAMVREMQEGRLGAGEYGTLRARLGWFVDEDGGVRWGVEMEEGFRGGPGVQWVATPSFGDKKKKGVDTWVLDSEGARV
ncbi:hypothetical protein N7462_002558 [Penicillium macrosclerotiorum]|uniref:uncharacterized protein n=1 Tax=Penicillium macrosclerotiorum TaxID=303699 RepID=UPI00254890A1|nr:uncharacterized protein N7462_002558 [Penicillium macrosclerotiorum]KAJ5693135.1 hypothetical protein N7462_002558 [Penicillium macrosclerotiorum]